MVVNIRDLIRQDDLIQTITGSIVQFRDEDEFLLQDATGQVWVATDGLGLGRRFNLAVGDRITVVGDLDDDDFDAIRITRANGMPVTPQFGGSASTIQPTIGLVVDIADLRRQDDLIQTISGRVVRVNEDEFVLRDRTGQVRVDADLRDDRRIELAVGDRIIVVGDLDDDDFDVLRIIRADGSVVLNRLGSARSSRRDDVLFGSDRSDVLRGRGGDDVLNGGRGRDRLLGGDGDDTLVGGAGRDELIGDGGSDRFVYQSLRDRGDRIRRFNSAEDVIDLSQLFDDDAFSSSQPFSNYVQWTQQGRNTVVSIDLDGTVGGANFRRLATLEGAIATTITLNNFVF